MKTCYIVLNLLNRVIMMMMFPAAVKMMAILRTWINISMIIALMSATQTEQMEKVRGISYIMMIMKETTMKKKNQV